jgi:DNA-binding CsgD family transcriptional regulator
MNQNKAIAYLRQLCCLGLDKETVIPEFLRAVENVILSGNNAFTGIDDQFKPSYVMLNFVPDDINEMNSILMDGYRTPKFLQNTATWFSQHPILTDITALVDDFYKSDTYNLLFRKYDQHYALWALVYQQGKPVGMLSLHRAQKHKPFDYHEQALLIRLLPYVAHALQVTNSKDIQYSEQGVLGMMIMDTQGNIHFLSPEAKNLLVLAAYPVLSLNAHSKENSVLQKLAHCCHNLKAIFQGKDAAPPSWSHTNGRGRFIFRAYWLNKQHNEPDDLICLSIEHQEPLTLIILRMLQNQALSPMQKEVALLVAQGFSNEKVGERLHIKITTVKDYISTLFTRLDISHRNDLLPKLMELERVNSGLSEIQLSFRK